MTTTLDQILDSVRRRVAAAKRDCSMDDVVRQANDLRRDLPPFRLRSSIEKTGRLNIIAEFKRASPSKGIINDGVAPKDVATAYERGGATAISVLTEPDFFRGSLDDLREVRDAVSIPVLRKDFVVDAFQIYEAALAGADAILLIVAALSPDELKTFSSIAGDLGLDTLVEVHTADEMAVAKEIGATLVGVNNRNLRTFEVSLDVSRDLIHHASSNAMLIAESGFRTRDELLELQSLGYNGFLIGETLMRGANGEEGLKELLNDEG